MRFHRAVYRFWLFCTSFCYPAREVPFQAGGEINHSEYHAQFLRPFSAEELLDIRRVADFCADMVGWVTDYQTITPRPVSAEQTAIFTAYCRSNAELAPDYALEIYRRLRIFHKQSHVRSFFWGAYDRAIAEKLPTTAQDREERLAKAILREVYGEHDTCHRCHAVGGLKLYGKTNWHWMRGEFNWTKLRGLLPGNLPPNKYEGGRLAQRACTPDGYARMMEEIFDARCASPQQMHAQAHAPGAGAWDAEGLYCAACVEVLLGERLWVWCDARQQRESDSVREDCCYGWGCRTQVHNIEHAEMLNHFCMPARDDSEDPESHRV
ncbi:hypothetical protein WOLCODRAFT_135095 [Wolfiporia cocos MD-104 SS10]|uniref:Uncharacterized protein n=1 Tax=Wolfiporia cocos (strain MD-104) TaxID=742152 RepID=A0A2H3ITS0_WOLCO|nr:hypothetical protein WOLCODRAFT_135095 [Wolfiporia cocos MD-104 SS10]